MEVAFKFALAAGVAVMAYFAFRPRPTFVVTVRSGVPRVTRGAVSDGFLSDVADIVAAAGIETGRVLGWRAGNRISLGFSRNMPAAARQRIRNAWAAAK